MMTFWMVLNNRKWEIKHANSLSALRFLIEDTPFKDVICLLPVASVSELSKLKSSSKQFCNSSEGAFTELH